MINILSYQYRLTLSLRQYSPRLLLLLGSGFLPLFFLTMLFTFLVAPVRAITGVNEAELRVSKSVSEEPLLGGAIGFRIDVQNVAANGDGLEDDKAYNVTIVDTLPAGLTFLSGAPAPEEVLSNPDGTTTLRWNNFTDLEAEEEASVSIQASLDPALTLADTITNTAEASANTLPDNSGSTITASDSVAAVLQAIDVEKEVLQSTGVSQATGAGGWEAVAPGSGGGPEWPFQYRITVRNNNVGDTESVVVTDTLPAGVAYLGAPAISPNPNGVAAEPALTVLADGRLQLAWDLGTLTPDEFTNPPVITFEAAIAYRQRLAAAGAPACINNVLIPNDVVPTDPGCFDGPVIADGSVWANAYDATGVYLSQPTADGSTFTPADDPLAHVTAKYQTVEKSVTPTTVKYLDEVTFRIDYYVSEYYSLTGSIITDVLPDGMSYVPGSASITPTAIVTDFPGAGETTIRWELSNAQTTPGSQGAITFDALVDFDYEVTNDPIVALDSLVNRVQIEGDWTDAVDPRRDGDTADSDTALVNTDGPLIDKQVRDPDSGLFVDTPVSATVGDVLEFQLLYRAPAGVDARDNYLADFLPRGMSLVQQTSCAYTGAISNTFTSGDADNDPCTYAEYVEGGLNVARWNFGFTTAGFVMTSTIQAQVDDVPAVADGVIVANFLKASGTNTPGETYSLRDLVHINYLEPTVVVTKTAAPQTGLRAGDQVAYTIDLVNTSPVTAYNVALVDTVPPLLDFNLPSCAGAPAAASCSVQSGAPQLGSGGEVIWTAIASLAPGATQTFSYTATVMAGIQSSSLLTNTASATFNTQADGSGRDTLLTDNPADPNTDSETVETEPITVDKQLAGTSLAATAGSDMTIGEGLIYQVTLNVPEGVANAVTLTDVLDRGLAFVRLVDISASTSLSWDGAATAVFGEYPAGSDNAQDLGRRMVIDFGTVSNADLDGATTETITITYEATVLDVPAVADGLTRRNSVSVDLGYEVATDSVTVMIVEPDLNVIKTAVPHSGDAGDIVTFTLTLSHDAGHVAAADVLLSDSVPAGMSYVPGSWTQLDGPAMTLEDSSAPALTAALSLLEPGQSATLQFQARLDMGVEPRQTIVNEAGLEWYSMLAGQVITTALNTNDNRRDYRTSDSDSITISSPTIGKQVMGTNLAATGGVNVAIGEIITYQVAVNVPEGILHNARLADTLDSGLALVAIDTITASPGITTSVGAFDDVEDSLSVSGSGRVITLDFGTVTNSNVDNAVAESIIITYRVAVLNTTNNNRGTQRNNAAVWSWDRGSISAGAPNVIVVEPELVLAKTADPAEGDAGDTITFTLILNHSGGSNSTAYDLVVSDVVPAGMTYVPGSLTHVSGVAATLADGAAPTLTAAIATLATGQNSVIRFQATLDSDVTPGASIANSADLAWTSLPGDITSSQSTHTTVASERTGSTLNPGGSANDYSVQATADVTLSGGAITKALVNTSATHTGGSEVTIGEVITYVLSLSLPEGVIPGLTVTDTLPAGLAYLPGTAVIDGDNVFGGTLTPGDPAISAPGGSGDPLVFSFGVIAVPADNDPANNVLTIAFQARVLDEPGNRGRPPQTTLNNVASMRIDGGSMATSGVVPVNVVEPQMAIAKSFIPGQAAAGETVTIQLQVQNTGTSTAFDVVVEDALPVAIFTAVAEGSTPAGFSFSAMAAPSTTTVRYEGGPIAPGETRLFTFSAEVTANVSNGQLITNVATVSQATTLPGSDPDERDEPDVDGGDTLPVLGPDLVLEKDNGLTAVGPGQLVTYTLAVTNSGAYAAPGVVLTDTIPANTQFVSAGDGGSNGGGTVTWLLGTLEPGAVVTRTLAVRIDAPLPPGITTITNRATAGDDGTYGIDPTPGNNSDDDVDEVTRVDLELTKVVDNTSPNLGETITFTLAVTNQGPDIATGVTIFDVLPAGLEYVAGTASQGSYDSDTGVWDAGGLNNGQTETLHVTALVVATGAITNTAQVQTADQYDVDSVAGNDEPGEDDHDEAGINVAEAADLEVIKTVDNERPSAADTVVFTVAVTNQGPDTATALTVADTLPAGLDYAGSSASQGEYDSVTGIWDVGTLGNGGVATLAISATLTGPGVFTNTAQVQTSGHFDVDSTPGNDDPAEDDQDSATVATRLADLELAKSVNDGTPNLGAVITYTITLTNAGPDTASGVAVADLLPAGLTYAGAVTSQGSYDSSAGLWEVGTLANGQTATLALPATVITTGPITNTAQVQAADQFDLDSEPGNNAAAEDDHDSVAIDVPPAADLELAKSVDNPFPLVGETVVFTLTVANQGPDTATGVSVRDNLPTGLTYIDDIPGQGSYDSSAGTWNVGTLAKGQVATLAISATVSSHGVFTNTAQVQAADQFDLDSLPGNDQPAEDDQDEVGVDTRRADLALAKSVDNATPFVNDTITYTLTLANHGPDSATGVTVIDYLPAGLVYVAHVADQGSFNSGTGLWDVGLLLNGQTVTLTVRVKVVAPGHILNTASVHSTELYDPVVANNDDETAVDAHSEPTAVTLIAFTVTRLAGQQVLVQWQTAAEVDNFGFRLYRNATENFATATEIHFEPPAVPGGNGPGAIYDYTDTVPAYGYWYYWLVDVDTDGATGVHGPVSLNLTHFYTIFLPVLIGD